MAAAARNSEAFMLDRTVEARLADTTALALTANPAERALLEQRLI